MNTIVDVLKIFIPVALFFVWVVRYPNIVKEFQQYALPDWTRDLVGILKLSFGLMIAVGSAELVKIGAAGIVVLMGAALVMHLKVKNPFSKMLPALTLLILSAFIFIST